MANARAPTFVKLLNVRFGAIVEAEAEADGDDKHCQIGALIARKVVFRVINFT